MDLFEPTHHQPGVGMMYVYGLSARRMLTERHVCPKEMSHQRQHRALLSCPELKSLRITSCIQALSNYISQGTLLPLLVNLSPLIPCYVILWFQ